MIVKIHQVSGAMWIHLGIKNCLEKTKNSPFTQKSEVSLHAQKQKEAQMVVVVKSRWFILFSQFWGTCFLFVFMHASRWQNCSAPRAWKEVLGIYEGVWQQRNISVLTKRQGEEGKRICSHRRIDHPSQVWSLSPAFHFSDLPPVNKTGTSRTAPEVL